MPPIQKEIDALVYGLKALRRKTKNVDFHHH
jgi:hypothetical protein